MVGGVLCDAVEADTVANCLFVVVVANSQKFVEEDAHDDSCEIIAFTPAHAEGGAMSVARSIGLLRTQCGAEVGAKSLQTVIYKLIRFVLEAAYPEQRVTEETVRSFCKALCACSYFGLGQQLPVYAGCSSTPFVREGFDCH